jgi:hypothetical protein
MDNGTSYRRSADTGQQISADTAQIRLSFVKTGEQQHNSRNEFIFLKKLTKYTCLLHFFPFFECAHNRESRSSFKKTVCDQTSNTRGK